MENWLVRFVEDWLVRFVQAAEAANWLKTTAPLILASSAISSAVVAFSILAKSQLESHTTLTSNQKYHKPARFFFGFKVYYISWHLLICSPMLLQLKQLQPWNFLIYIIMPIIFLGLLIRLSIITRLKPYKSLGKKAAVSLEILGLMSTGTLTILSWLLFVVIPTEWMIEGNFDSAISLRGIYALFVSVFLGALIPYILRIGFRLFDLALSNSEGQG